MARLAALLLFTLLVAPAAAQGEVGLVLLVHHPYPDAADPLGFPFAGGDRDYYTTYYAHLDEEGDGFDFPHAIFDGTSPIEGLPDEGAPFDSTRDAYETAFLARNQLAAPVTIEVASQVTGLGVLAAIRIVPETPLDGERLRVWTALVEDHVFYDGGRLGNGVTDHRFTVRAITDHGAIDLSNGTTVPVTATYPLAEGPERHFVAVWVQQSAADGLRFDAHEVVQAAIHDLSSSAPTVQHAKGVLMQLFSATWCDPCLFGDLAAEELADVYGVSSDDPGRSGPTYWRGVPVFAVFAALLAAGAAAFVRLPRGDE